MASNLNSYQALLFDITDSKFNFIAGNKHLLRSREPFKSNDFIQRIKKSRVSRISASELSTESSGFLLDKQTSHYVCIRLPGSNSYGTFAVILCFENQASSILSEKKQDEISALCEVISEQIALLQEVNYMMNENADLRARVCEPQLPYQIQSHPSIDNDLNIAVKFLSETIVRKRSLLSRNSVVYHSLNQWRTSIKSHQISAIRLLKETPDSPLVPLIRDEIKEWIFGTFGRKAFDTVVPVPCGHSGSDCLSRQISIAVAQQIGATQVDAFAPLKVRGSSHPRTNTTRPKMELCRPVKGRVLLVDDIASSGSHIEEAVRMLREIADSVVAVCWIGGSK